MTNLECAITSQLGILAPLVTRTTYRSNGNWDCYDEEDRYLGTVWIG